VLVRTSKAIAAIAILLALGLGVAWGQAQQQPTTQKKVKDQGEYDLYMAITKEANAEAKLKLLDQWKEKYPATDFQLERLAFYLDAYQRLNRPAEIVSTAKSILEIEPRNLRVLSAVAYFTLNLPKPAPDDLSAGERAAKGVLGVLDAEFVAEKKPANVSEADWNKAKTATEAMAYRTLGWVAMQRKDNEAAEKSFARSLELNPEQGEISYWLGGVILAQKKPERQADALFHFARAAAYTGPGALSPQGRQQVEAYLAKAYRTYHGEDEAGLKALHELARANLLPPAGFKIKSRDEIEAEKREALAKADPALALWVSIKENLTGEGGEKYFQDNMKDALVPPENMPAFKGTLIRSDPVKNPKKLVLRITDPEKPEVTLILEEALTGVAEPGTALQFRGAPTSFTKEPFMVTFDVEKDKVTGWPAPTPTKKAPPAKKGVVKKK